MFTSMVSMFTAMLANVAGMHPPKWLLVPISDWRPTWVLGLVMIGLGAACIWHMRLGPRGGNVEPAVDDEDGEDEDEELPDS